MRNWICTQCNFLDNDISRDICKKCLSGRDKHMYIKIGDWTCPVVSCRFYNFAREYKCIKCKTDRPTDDHFILPTKNA